MLYLLHKSILSCKNFEIVRLINAKISTLRKWPLVVWYDCLWYSLIVFMSILTS